MTIQVDPETGFKTFNTRAALATDKIAGRGYAVVDDQALKDLPEPPVGAVFNAEEQAKYRNFKEARRGAADYIPMEGSSADTWRTYIPLLLLSENHLMMSARYWL